MIILILVAFHEVIFFTHIEETYKILCLYRVQNRVFRRFLVILVITLVNENK